MTKPPIAVITSVERRRRWSREDKERLFAPCLEPGAVLSEIARAAGIHVSRLFRWRKELCQIEEPKTETTNTLVPVIVSQAAPTAALAADETVSPGSKLSSTIRSFCSVVHRLRTKSPAITSMRRYSLDISLSSSLCLSLPAYAECPVEMEAVQATTSQSNADSEGGTKNCAHVIPESWSGICNRLAALANSFSASVINQFAALVSLAYNVGPANLNASTLLKKVNASDSEGVADFGRWVKSQR